MKVSIVIPNYNGKHFMESCMKSLDVQTMRDFEVIVVDNGSTDGSAEYIKADYPDIRLIELAQNTGFTGAVNTGIKASQAPYVLLLNNDTECEPDFVGEMYRAIAGRRKVFSVSSKMIRMYDKNSMDNAGDLYSIVGWAFNRGAGRPVEEYNVRQPIFSACGGAAIYNKAVFDKIGYFDNEFFAYREDLDIGYRAKIYGYDNIYCPTAKVYHVGSGTSGSTHNSFKVRLSARNQIYVNYKNMPAFFLILNFPFLLAGYLVKLAFFMKKGLAGDYLKGTVEAFQNLDSIKKVPFQKRHLVNYLVIQFELCLNTLLGFEELSKK